MTKLKVEHLDFSIDKTQILKAIDLNIQKGEFVGLVGPNGCGKSTLLKNIYRIYQPDHGKIYLGGQLVDQVNDKAFAKKMAVMVQENTVEFDLTVIDMVMLGRYAHKRLLQDSSEKDRAIAEKYLDEVGLKGYEERSFLSLSGGEKQRVLLARALSQEAELIVLDEPTNHLDIKYQYQIMNILKRQDMTVFTSVHDLNIAALYCDRIVVLKKGKLVKIGTPEEVITPEMIRYLYGIDSEVHMSETTGRPQIQFLPNFDL
ncbi:ABC transporter ATP-binding protein [Pseudoramibacter porci]|uniref:ABC transporter ATP-binding protein n=1 Tax=Pseudoramibacter porci TaxID=2606631 RepID=A0A7X2T8Y8_9FIRM|nr:ABC transporter ATP-binding protein [Pseudoramibacter porci]MSS18999.1 ABC transporter ATP-binding protein [Pseudoramibacter porci]